MDRLVQVERDKLAAELRLEMEQALGKVMDAVNAAREGRLIADSELPVFELMKDLERRVYEKALQLRVDSTESTFSPSDISGGQAQDQQGPRDGQPTDAAGPHPTDANPLLRSGRRQRRAG